MNYSLTSRGVADLIAHLYSLSDNELEDEANSIRTDFKLWIMKYFALTSDQKTYLQSMSTNSTQQFGYQCWFCFIHRLKISLDYPAPPSPTGYGKWTDSASTAKLSTNSNGDEVASGELKFIMVYKAL